MTIEAMKTRSGLVTKTREFFLSRDYIETDTPLLAPWLIPESSLEAFATEFKHPFRQDLPLYLLPSPELWMKRIIATHRRNVFQLCKSFRNAESLGRLHNPEFTMLEYYTVGGDSNFSARLTEELFETLLLPESPQEARPPFRRITMAEAFKDCAGLDLDSLMESDAMIEAARSQGLLVNAQASWEEAFNIVFLSIVEPALPMDKPLLLDEYPAGIECLAKDIPGKPYKERWELYVQGIEVANCFTEMAEPRRVASYFSSQAEKKARALVPHAIDMRYPELFRDFPSCSGVAIGFDRLFMVLTGLNDIGRAMNFPFTTFLEPEGT
ncbi:MAG: amino acid--tRNA ligase-related protein [Spirochaetia bacterium]|jgi:lysyl-tRNA synthetase class 2|nr:LysR family transcriptional regulator [Spirochaetales bacterium]MDX9783324.1 amino acid--tRNA ligase-related protein [Spirochaetia bacterium]